MNASERTLTRGHAERRPLPEADARGIVCIPGVFLTRMQLDHIQRVSVGLLLRCRTSDRSQVRGQRWSHCPASSRGTHHCDWIIHINVTWLQAACPMLRPARHVFIYLFEGGTETMMYIETIMPFLFLYRFYTSPVCWGTIYCLNYLSEWKFTSKSTM